MKGGEHLYVVQSHTTGAFKVGRSSNVEKRLKQLQTGSPYHLRVILILPGQGHRERELHRKLKGYESQSNDGGEWFIEPGLPSIGDDLYDLLNPCVFENWWETAVGPIHPPGPPRGWLSTPRSHHRPFVAED